jgi:hypothetical protein
MKLIKRLLTAIANREPDRLPIDWEQHPVQEFIFTNYRMNKFFEKY